MADDPRESFVEEVQNEGNIDARGEYIAADCIDHSAHPGVPEGLAGAETIFRK